MPRVPRRLLARGASAAALLILPLAAVALEINQASRAELERIDGVGVATAARILEARERDGDFRDWPDLAQRVPGLRGRNLERIKREPGLTVGGQPGAIDPHAPRPSDPR